MYTSVYTNSDLRNNTAKALITAVLEKVRKASNDTESLYILATTENTDKL